MFFNLGSLMESHLQTQLHTTNSEDETIELGKHFAERLHIGDIVAFYGGLGAGKTEFVKGICEHFHVPDIVSSPTFTIMNQYDGTDSDGDDIKLYHVDLYRINSQREFDDIGFDDCMFTNNAIKLVEWAEKANGHMPKKRYSVKFILDDKDENKRTIEITKSEQ